MKVLRKDRLKIALCEALQRWGAKLHMAPSVLATMGFTITDSQGNVVRKVSAKSNSFVRNYYNFVASYALLIPPCNDTQTALGTFGDGVDTPLKNVSNVLAMNSYIGTIPNRYGSQGYTLEYSVMLYAAPGVATQGILVGTGTGAESFDSYNLTTKINHGVGSGQLSYGAMSNIASRSWNSVTKKLTATFTRTFTNSSGADITINEIGFFVNLQQTANYGPYMLIRDLLSAPITLQNGQALTLSYNLSQIMSN